MSHPLRRKAPRRVRTQTGQLVFVNELPSFERDANVMLSAEAKQRLFDLVANCPMSGEVLQGYDGLRQVEFDGHVVVYGASPNFSIVYMIMLTPVGGGGGGSGRDGGKFAGRAKSALKWLVKGGFLGVGKKIGEELSELLWRVRPHGAYSRLFRMRLRCR